MKVLNPNLLKSYRQLSHCEWCKRPSDTIDGHHIVKRSQGRVDYRLNLIGLCRGFAKGGWVSCHDEADAGRITQESLWAVVAQREGIIESYTYLETIVQRIIRADKWCYLCPQCEGVGKTWEVTSVLVCGLCQGQAVLDANGMPWRELPRTFAS